MRDFDIVHFYQSSEIFEKAEDVFLQEKKFLEILIPGADIQHVGSCAIPGAVGKFDVDIQIRVSQAEFSATIESLKKKYSSKHPEIWTNEFAIFMNPASPVDIDYMVTVTGSKFDDFSRTRDFLIANPDMLQKYNELKLQYEGRPYQEYRTAKIEFLGGNGSVKFLEY